MQQTISIIIPNYNGKHLLQKNLAHVIDFKKKYKQIVEIIIVDDNSVDGSLDYVKSTFPEVKTIGKTSNTGFSDSVNMGIEESKGSLILLLNTDVKPDLNLIPPVLKYFKNKKTFAVGCLENSFENGKIVKRGRGIGLFKNGYLTHSKGDIHKNNTLWVSGGSSIFNKSILLTLGGFDSIFNPFYWEDIDLSYRALKSGYDIYFEKNAQVTHKHEQGSIINQYTRDQIEEIALRNQIMFVWKNISKIDYLVNHLIYLIKDVAISIARGNTIYLKALLRASLKIPLVLINRVNQSKLWVKSDDSILEQFRYE